MASRNYYYLIAGLPDLTIDQGKLQFGSVEFRKYLKTQLHRKDYELIEWLFLPHDNQNLLKLLNKEDFVWDEAGIYTREEMEMAFTEEPYQIKPYMVKFIASFKSEIRLMPEKTPENELTTIYFNEVLKVKNDFLRAWFEFDLNLRNLILFSSAQKYNLSCDQDLIGNNKIASTLKQKVGRDIGEAAEWLYYEKVNQALESGDIAVREKAIDQLKWNYLNEMNTFNYFSIEIIVSYIIKLTIIERWLKLDPKEGEKLFRRLLGDLQSSYEFPKEFNVNDGKK
ncbi:MAG: DUF2764 family protein [Lentimicrobiaceae bacterium]